MLQLRKAAQDWRQLVLTPLQSMVKEMVKQGQVWSRPTVSTHLLLLDSAPALGEQCFVAGLS